MDGNIEKMQSLTGRIKGFGIDKTLTKKGMCAEAEATGKALATKVNITDIVDDLTSVADDKPLSANQGRVLKKQIDEIDPHYAENVLYNDTNVKDALDKVSKAENIAYDGDKSVQGAIEDVQTQIDNLFSGVHKWTPIATSYNAERCTYVKTRDMLTIWFELKLPSAISQTTKIVNVCTNVKEMFGLNNFENGLNNSNYYALTTVFCTGGINLLCIAQNNKLYMQYINADVDTSKNIYGQISIPIY